MVLHKELRVCKDLPVVLVEQGQEIARGTASKLLEDCSNGILPDNAFVRSIDIITPDNMDSSRFKNIEFNENEFKFDVPYLIIKIKIRA